MTNDYAQVFLALALRNKLLTHDRAQSCLSEFRAQPEAPDRPTIEDIVRFHHLLTDAQIAQLQAAAKKVMAPPDAPTPNPAEPIPGYRIKGKIAAGGTATVFLAEDRKNGDRAVALKILHPTLAKDERALERFLRESRLLVEFDHANLVKGFEFGTNGPLAWVAMELLEGESAQAVLDRVKRTAESRALEIILEAAKALEYMQSKGVVHRDIKPGNIMILNDGRIKVCDLGFAQSIEASGGEAVVEETTSGTAQYMSPEQARGQVDLDVRADIYSLGATLYHLVMGELPFSGGDSLEVMAKQVMEALNSSEIKNRRISRHMHYFIERMMSKEKALRYATPRELIDDITEQIEGFKSLEFNADEARQDSAILKHMNSEEGEGDGARKAGPVSTRRFRKIDEITRRFRKEK